MLASKFAKYGECNVCINVSDQAPKHPSVWRWSGSSLHAQGTVPLTRPPQKCVDGTYHCRCSGVFGHDAPCPPAMGRVGVVGLVNMFVDYIHINQTGPSQHWWGPLSLSLSRVHGGWF